MDQNRKGGRHGSASNHGDAQDFHEGGQVNGVTHIAVRAVRNESLALSNFDESAPGTSERSNGPDLESQAKSAEKASGNDQRPDHIKRPQ